MADLQAQAGQTAAAVLRGEWPDNIVNPQVRARLQAER